MHLSSLSNIKGQANAINKVDGYVDTVEGKKGIDYIDDVDGGYYWNNFCANDQTNYPGSQSIYFITSTANGGKDELQAIGATNLGSRTNDNKANWDNYFAEVELIVNAKEFRLNIEINDNWSEEENGPEGEGQTSNYKEYPDLGLQGATVEIIVTAASVQATGGEEGEVINKDHAVKQLYCLLPGYDFNANAGAGGMRLPLTPDFTPANP